jgi:hypothetical protein
MDNVQEYNICKKYADCQHSTIKAYSGTIKDLLQTTKHKIEETVAV